MNQENTLTTIGGRVRFARLRRGLGTNELDRAIGGRAGYISRLEADGFESVGSDKLAALSEVLGVTMDWLVKGGGEEQLPSPAASPPAT